MWDSICTETSSFTWASTNCSDPPEAVFGHDPTKAAISPSDKRQKKMNTSPLPIVFRELRPDERPLLREFLLRAIYLPEGTPPPPPEIVESPELKIYFEDFGLHDADHALVAAAGEEVIGCVWCRRMHDFGYVDPQTPSLALSLREEYRGRGIGTRLLENMLRLLRRKDYAQVSLSVQKANPAFRLYKRLGFETARETDEEFILVRKL